MTYWIGWDDAAHSVVRQTYYGSIGRCDIEGMVRESRVMLESVSYPVDLIIEWDERTTLLPDFSILSIMMYTERYVPANQRYVFPVNTPPIYQAMGRALQKATPKAAHNVYFVNTRAHAYTLRSLLLEAAPVPTV
jgi:hypothetical protein